MRFLIDAGLSAKALEQSLKAIDVAPESLDGILITHEHTDHVGGLDRFVKKYNTPVFANYNTAAAIERQCLCAKREVPEFTWFESGLPFMLGEITLTPVPIPHDTAEPVAYTIDDGSHRLGYFTDLGHVTETIAQALSGCTALVLESNHDLQMLRNSGRGFQLISRISGRAGHLSNDQACEAIALHASPELRTLTLAHLSRDCNQPEIAAHMMRGILKHIGRTDVTLAIAKQDEALPFTEL
jgi:phosphoribosyl 1,2-cyclic phosphodiesterase